MLPATRVTMKHGDDKDDDDLTPKNVKVNGMDEEEEELGKVCIMLV